MNHGSSAQTQVNRLLARFQSILIIRKFLCAGTSHTSRDEKSRQASWARQKRPRNNGRIWQPGCGTVKGKIKGIVKARLQANEQFAGSPSPIHAYHLLIVWILAINMSPNLQQTKYYEYAIHNDSVYHATTFLMLGAEWGDQVACVENATCQLAICVNTQCTCFHK